MEDSIYTYRQYLEPHDWAGRVGSAVGGVVPPKRRAWLANWVSGRIMWIMHFFVTYGQDGTTNNGPPYLEHYRPWGLLRSRVYGGLPEPFGDPRALQTRGVFENEYPLCAGLWSPGNVLSNFHGRRTRDITKNLGEAQSSKLLFSLFNGSGKQLREKPRKKGSHREGGLRRTRAGCWEEHILSAGPQWKGGGGASTMLFAWEKNPGIYRSWDEAGEQVTGVPGAQHKSFPTYEEVVEYMAKNRPRSGTGASPLLGGSARVDSLAS
ncbi:hypothetical protein PIB30_047642 [Stylosanthes scabra]|uniref:Ribonuclease H1 N-terminal domain-containing protein n=1 Tax=Stylosanthes scabra TaxID=79078 RepID=A0ABU6UI69_9FABA|nr:hypothetical protein [Stylosanthes scabra]